MDFKANKPIYQQIADFCYGNILTGKWPGDSRIPSVRELAVQLAVNSHTVLKAYEYLQAEDIIYPRRGLGFFLSADAPEKVMKLRQREFFDSTLHEVFEQMDMLGISIDDMVVHYEQYKAAK